MHSIHDRDSAVTRVSSQPACQARHDPGVAAANLALKFLLELAAIAAFAYWGATTGSGAVPVVLAISAPALMVVLWGRLAAPRAPHRLPATARIPFELTVFALAAAALIVAGALILGIAFAAIAAANAALLTAFDQWEA